MQSHLTPQRTGSVSDDSELAQPDPSKPDLHYPMPISCWQRVTLGDTNPDPPDCLGHAVPVAQRKSFSGDVQMQAVGAETQEAREGPSEQWKCPRGHGWSPTVSTTLGTLTPGRMRYQERLP